MTQPSSDTWYAGHDRVDASWMLKSTNVSPSLPRTRIPVPSGVKSRDRVHVLPASETSQMRELRDRSQIETFRSKSSVRTSLLSAENATLVTVA